MTSAAATILSQVQKDACVWAKKNFGTSVTPEVQLLGMAEEHGEAAEAMGDTEAFCDAIGDSTIFLMQFMTLLGWDIGQLWDWRKSYELPSRPWPILVGKLCHHYVKGYVQHYRGSRDEHEHYCRVTIGALLRYWDEHLSSLGHDFVAVVERTWAEVSARDWTRDRPAPERARDEVWVVTSGLLFQTSERGWEVSLPSGTVGRGWHPGKLVSVMVEQASLGQMRLGDEQKNAIAKHVAGCDGGVTATALHCPCTEAK